MKWKDYIEIGYWAVHALATVAIAAGMWRRKRIDEKKLSVEAHKQ
jgi:hypothetical protein